MRHEVSAEDHVIGSLRGNRENHTKQACHEDSPTAPEKIVEEVGRPCEDQPRNRKGGVDYTDEKFSIFDSEFSGEGQHGSVRTCPYGKGSIPT